MVNKLLKLIATQQALQDLNLPGRMNNNPQLTMSLRLYDVLERIRTSFTRTQLQRNRDSTLIASFPQ
jgi:hypothetical protein